jgi:AcrR family transcriptional regulator
MGLYCLFYPVNITCPPLPNTKHSALLDAAVSTFARYGFRKTSMDEVARAAGVSRQGLYLIFSNKEELFRRAVEHSLGGQLTAAISVLSRSENTLEQRLVAACDEWSGRFIGMLGADATDLMCASTTLAGSTLKDYEARFEAALASVISDSPMASRCRDVGVCSAEAARLLHATAQGLKRSSATREDFLKGMTVAARLFCAERQSE